jgi:uncharacterized protein
MRLYLDSSALAKRPISEAESQPLERYLGNANDSGSIFVSSALAWVEVGRVLRGRLDLAGIVPTELSGRLDTAFAGVAEAPVSAQVISLARRIGPPTLRSLDAIHLATATLIDADVVVAYDRRLLQAAEELGFATASPS